MMMNKQVVNILKLGRKIYTGLFPQREADAAPVKVVRGQEASDLIRDKLLADKPAMISKFGAVELSCVANYMAIVNHPNNYINYLLGKSEPFWWDESTMFLMSNNAGFFPATPEMLAKFSELMIDDMQMVDILGTWQKREKLFRRDLHYANRVGLYDLEPYNHQHPWSAALEGKKVLVVHPFVESIREQYRKRELLFENEQILPNFELKTLRAVQSIANAKTGFKNWFEALDHMKEKIASIDFDIAIIGCGAYGFPLAAHVKRIGKKAVHLGGATQTLFGIRGKRWENQKEHNTVAKMMNEHWIRPFSTETPSGIQSVEDGCYW